MANSRMIVFGLAIFLVCFCFIKVTKANHDKDDNDQGSSSTIHAFQRDPDEACKAKHSHSGEECREDDDDDDVDDAFRGPIRLSLKVEADETPMENDDDDSPDSMHNNVVVLGH
ncbi:hypothetical protein L6164_031496 [Bauhinia variegata]|uniref:Uncharacterized protein n=1 Tax=Bauhinia variegata TaxID=167791 RepID=A0ACB9LFM6_BAUVA|nr:hypothetical protein L6164_031496 [Bauhinia variegata]